MSARLVETAGSRRRLPPAWLAGTAVAGSWALFLSHALLVAHVVLVPHSFSRETGKVVHGGQEAPRDHESGGAPESGSPEEECQVFAVLHQTSSLPPSSPPPAIEAVVRVPERPDTGSVSKLDRRPIYLVAPTLSPPALQG